MDNNRIVVARLWGRYVGGVPSRAPIILGMDPDRYRTICVYLKKSSDEPNYFVSQGCKVFFVSKRQFFRVFNIFAVWKLVNILRSEKVDILHCHLHQATVYGTIAARLAGVRVVISHVHGVNRTVRWRRRLTNSILFRWVSRIVTVGEATRRDVLSSNPVAAADQVTSIGNSIEYDKYAMVSLSRDDAKLRIGIGVDSFVYGTIGRLSPNKGQGTLIEAFVRVKRQMPRAVLVLVGSGRLGDDLRHQADETGFGDSIIFLGQRDDIPEVLHAFDVFVLPSLAEGLPRSLMEAMAAGVACIGSSSAGIPEILIDGELGEIVPPNEADTLAEAMLKVARMPAESLACRLDAARERIRSHYNHDIVLGRLRDIYETEFSKSHEGGRRQIS